MHAEIVFIDTNVFEQFQFDFSHSTLRAVCSAYEAGDIALVTTEITDWEIRKHLEKKVLEAIRAVKKHRVLNNIDKPFFDEGAVLKKCLASYESFLGSSDTSIWPISPTASRSALDMYLQQEPPFTGSKSHREFPDACVIATIAEHLTHGGGTIIACTLDKGFAEACKEIKGVTLVKSLKDLLEHVSKRKEAHYALLLDEVKKAIQTEKNYIDGLIRNRFDNIGFDVSDFYADIEDLEAGKIDFNDDVCIISVAKDEIVAQLTFNVDYSFSVSGRQVIRDPVDKDYVDIGSKSAPGRTGDVSGTITSTFSRSDDSVEVVETEIELPSSISVEIDDDEWSYDE